MDWIVVYGISVKWWVVSFVFSGTAGIERIACRSLN